MSAKSILVTGCSSGIGYDAAHRLAKHGWRVFATCRQQKDCARLTAGGLESFRLDYRDADSMQTAVETALDRTGGTLDALFNNGAFGLPGGAEDLPVEALRDIFETNVFGYHALTRLVIPAMRAQGHGRVLNTGSVLGYSTIRWRSAYVATKYALEGLTDTWRLEMKDAGIWFSLIEPGPITTAIRVNSRPHFERWIDWENSPRADLYRETLLKRLYNPKPGRDPFEAPPSAVTRQVIRALTARRPAARYFVTPPAYATWYARKYLPSRLMDWFQGRV